MKKIFNLRNLSLFFVWFMLIGLAIMAIIIPIVQVISVNR